MTKPRLFDAVDQKWILTDSGRRGKHTIELHQSTPGGDRVLATVSLYDDGLIEFRSETMELGIEQAGTSDEKVVFLRVPSGQFTVGPIRD